MKHQYLLHHLRGENMLEKYQPDQELSNEEYKTRLSQGQVRLGELTWKLYQQKRSRVIAYEGWDAAGKGGNIRRLVEGLDPRGYRVHPIAAPKGDDASHHYLWRFWRRLPPKGEIAIFDRTWYGRVLVERVEGFATSKEWKRAFREINQFEQQLFDSGTIIVKFWIHISKEEQLTRFKSRETTDYKAWKLTEEDWRNRDKWSEYHAAIDEMLVKTSTNTAPWTVVEGNNKKFARIKTIETTIQALEKNLGKQKK